ncbi:acyl-CoA oxidase [Lophium mytilinum]|uniref:Acyl-coenzyme A oxidase n=1 Tax=Lophium mytilinum TaxID=390894 RepID=A0A6A6QFM8_9PEZI|nr:acyl-CoA oxidase [Lophium mytilinum]
MPDFTDALKPAYDGAATLAGERAGSNIDADALSKHLLSRDGFLERQNRICKVLEGEKLFDKSQQMNLSRPDRYHLGLARAKAIRRLVHKHSWDHEDAKMAEYLTDEMSPFHLHLTMFVTTIREQASDEQRAYWMPKIMDWSILGCYAQSELGHGSNVRGLETTATWDPEKKEFEIHSPTLTASKWWNGSMGRTATHAIVVAQILIPSPKSGSALKSHGPHPFIVQIRDTKTHLPLPGIVVGDIGPKYGYASMDNGYMLFDHFRVSKSAMLSRYATLDDSTGAFTKRGHPGLVYGSLTFVRANIIMNARLVLARAVTIAVRYSCVRRQFHDRDEKGAGPEMKVLDYPTVQIRILPLLATTFALHYTGEMMFELYGSTRESIERGDFSTIAELHSASSGLKSLCTTLAADGIETCRRAMGGHGFGGGSGLVGINADYLSKPTVEGDNWMITQQVAAYLIKKMTTAVEKPDSPPADSVDELFQMYIRQRDHRIPQNAIHGTNIDDKAIVEIFQWRAADLTYRAYRARVVDKKSWNSLLIQLHELSRAYSEQILTTTFHRAFASTSSSSLSAPTPSVLRTCFRLYTLYTLSNSPLPFLTSLAVSQPTLDALPDTILSLMSELRPHAVKLVDAWAIPGYLLDSALGRYDGRVYEDLYDRAHRKNDEMNKTVFNVDWRSEEVVKGSGDDGKRILSKL